MNIRGRIKWIMIFVVTIYGKSEANQRGKALTQSDADSICSVVKELWELRNNLTQNMLVGEKTVDNGEKIVAHYSARAEEKKMLVDVLKRLIPEEENLSMIEKLLSDMGGPIQELRRSLTNMNASVWVMRMRMWNLVNISDSYAYWLKDMVEFFHYAAFGHGSCCLVVNGGSTGNCPSGDKRGSVPTDCTLQPPQRTEGGLAEYRNPLAKEPSLTMGNSGDHGDHAGYGCYITSSENGFNTKKSLIYELSGGLFNTSENALISNFTSVKKEFQNLINPLNTSVRKISAGNTSITAQRAALDGLLLKLEEEVGSILKRKETTRELTETLGTMKHVPWYDNESNESDGVSTKPNLSGVALLLVVLAVFWK